MLYMCKYYITVAEVALRMLKPPLVVCSHREIEVGLCFERGVAESGYLPLEEFLLLRVEADLTLLTNAQKRLYTSSF